MAKTRTGSIRQRGDSFGITVDTGKRDADGKRLRINRTVKGSRQDAERELRALLVDYERGQVATTRNTVSGLIDGWLKATSFKKKWATVERYNTAIRHHIEPYIGGKGIATLSRRDVSDFYSRLRADGRSPSTIRLVHAILSRRLQVSRRPGGPAEEPV